MPDTFLPNIGESTAWPGISAEILAVAAGRHDVPAMDDYRLGLHLGPAVNAACHCDGQRIRHRQAEGDLLFVPPGLPGSWQDDAACRFLRIRIAPSVFADAGRQLGLDPARLALPPRLHFRDGALEHAARALLALGATSSGATPSPTTGKAAAALGAALALRLLQSAEIRLPASTAAAQDLSNRGLSTRQRRMLEAFIEAALEHPLPLGDLAALLEISVSHLTALFRASYGLSPHQFILQRRLDRADSLLRDSDLPVSEIALAAGFAHQSHLANLMRRHRGITPQLRRRQYRQH